MATNGVTQGETSEACSRDDSAATTTYTPEFMMAHFGASSIPTQAGINSLIALSRNYGELHHSQGSPTAKHDSDRLCTELTEVLRLLLCGPEVKQTAYQKFLEGMWPLLSNFAILPSIFNFSIVCSQWANSIPTNFQPPPLPPAVTARKGTKNKIDNQTDSDGFTHPKKVNKHTTVEVIPEEQPLETSNNFTVLNVEDPPPNLEDNSDSMEESPVAPNNKSQRGEPFYIKIVPGWRKYISDIEQLTGLTLTVKVIGDFAKILTRDIDHFRTIQRYLTTNKIKGYSMNPRNERPRKVLLKGIAADIPSEEIKNELIARGFSVQRVTQIRKTIQGSQKRKGLNLFLCNLFSSENFAEIYKINKLLGFYVKVESYKSDRPRQCFNCQKFFHSSECCTMDPVCVKCAGPHKSALCTKKKKDPPKCANCKLAHPANYSGCEFNPKVIKARKAEKNPTIADVAKAQSNITPSAMSATPSPPQEAGPSTRAIRPTTYSNAVQNIIPTVAVVAQTPQPTSVPPPSPSGYEVSDEGLRKLEKLVELLEKVDILCEKMKLCPRDLFYKMSLNTVTPQPNSPLVEEMHTEQPAATASQGAPINLNDP